MVDPDVREEDLLSSLLAPYPSEATKAYPISRLVNNPRKDDERFVGTAA